MTAISNAKYHLEIQTHRKNPYGLLRNSYRVNGKTCHDTLCRITGLSLEQLRAIQAAIQGKMVMKEDFKITSSREFGASFAAVAIMKELGLHKAIFSRPAEEWVRSCLAMIAGRLVYAGSKLSLSQCSEYSALWEICGIEKDIDVNVHCYDAMDKLLERQEAIQKTLAHKHLQSGTLVLYDITSSYMEGEYSNSKFVDFGYSRDKKRGHKQIIISLLCTKDGCPVAVEVLNGNTKDETTVLDKINEIKAKFVIEKFVFVGDRGMVTQAKYEKIDHETVKVITALSHSTIKELLEKGTIQLSLFDEKNIVEVIDGSMRYCLCRNPVMAKKETETRKALLKKTMEELDKIVKCTKNTKYSKEVRAGKVINKYKMGKYIIFINSGKYLKYTLDEAKIEQEASLDGCYIVCTDVLPEDMTAIETVKNYKSLMRVEQAFRNMKTVRLEVRPVYHRTDERIKSHVFICMLSYYVMWHMKQRLQPFFDADRDGEHKKYSFDYIMEILKSIRKETVEFCHSKTSVITALTEKQEQILQLLAVKL